MGLKKLFRPPKEMDVDQSKEFLEKNGVVVKDRNNMYKKKFKFSEFGKYSEQMAQNQDNTLRPVVPNFNTGYGSYDEDINQGEGNQGYGYDEYANDYKDNKRNNVRNRPTPHSSYSYSGGYTGNYSSYNSGATYNSYSYSGSTDDNLNSYRSKPPQGRNDGMNRNEGNGYSSSAADQRRPKMNTYVSTPNSYNHQSLAATTVAATGITSSSEASVSSSNDYGYEPSLNNYNGYGFDPYSDTSVTSRSTDHHNLTKPPSSATVRTQSTYDPYAPGEEPYDHNNVTVNQKDEDGRYGSYQSNDPYNYNDDDDVDTITGKNNTNIASDFNGLTSGVQALQLQEDKQVQQQDQDLMFDPYGPSAGLQEQEQEQMATNNDLDLNAYEPAIQENVYDDDEFEEEVDEDEEELNRIQRQTKDVREDTVNLSRTLVDNLGQANVTATNTLGVLGNQREKIYEMENNLGTMKVQQRYVDDHVKDLEHYNRSLFHIKVNNPFTRNSRRRAKDQAFLAQRQEDRLNKDKLNSDLYQSQRAIMDQLKNDNVKSELQQKYDYDRRVKEASKYLTKDHDEEDERMEVEIAANVEQAQKLANNLKKKAQLMNSEIEQQNQDLKHVSENVDTMDDKIVMTTRRIRGI
jgi:hypothetical protein